MQSRIRMAYEKGCDALDPDNVDPFNDDFERGGGFTPPLTEIDSIDYLRKISNEAARFGMSMGMKNAESILPNVTEFIQFAVNEECTTYSTDEDGCWQYTPFLKAGKPVFHFEYVNVQATQGYRPQIQSIYKNWANLSSENILSYYCLRNNFGFPYLPPPDVGALFSTAIKKLDLGGWVMYCDGTFGETQTSQTVGGPDRELDPGWQGRQQGGKGKGGKKGDGPELLDPSQAIGGGSGGPPPEGYDQTQYQQPQQQQPRPRPRPQPVPQYQQPAPQYQYPQGGYPQYQQPGGYQQYQPRPQNDDQENPRPNWNPFGGLFGDQ